MRKPDPVEVVAVGAPVLVEAVVITFVIAVAVLWTGIWSHAI